MIKAKKGLLITLFAAMMMFAFGATTAFAGITDAKAEFNGDFTKVTISGCTEADEVYNGTYDTVRTYHQHNGITEAVLDDSKIAGFPATLKASVNFYNLNGAEFAKTDANGVIKATYLKPSDWAAVGAPDGLVLKDNEGTNKNPHYISFTDLSTGDWQVSAEVTPDFDPAATEDQTLTITLKESFDKDKPKTHKTGVVAPMTVTVKGYAAGDPTKALFFMDEVDPAATVSNTTAAYNGAEHTVVMKDVKGYTVKYQTYNTATGNWDDVDAIKIKDAGTINAKAQLYDAKGQKATGGEYSLTVTVTPLAVSDVVLGFPTTVDYPSTAAVYYVEGTEYDAYSFIDAAAKVADNDAAVAANKADLLALFKEAYDINAKVGKSNPNEIKLTIAPKATIDGAALVKKYEGLAANFGITATNVQSFATSAMPDYYYAATVYINAELIDEEIEFIDSPTAVTYKAKKLKKKAASFTVTAISNKGRTVSYKLKNAPEKITIDKATGEITLAKGLKKGKYNITVKAYIPGQSETLFETQDILIKVKK